MNTFLAAYVQSINGDPTYAWLITEDKIDGGACLGLIGPRDCLPELEARLQAPSTSMQLQSGLRRWRFRLYDDDGEHYFTGVLVTTADSPEDDETGPNGALQAPLDGIGEAYGCTRIAWEGHPEWEIG